MIEVKYNAWSRAKRKVRPEIDTIKHLDAYNKTRYARKKDLEGVLTEASKFFHENRKIYFATIYNKNKPINFLEINNDFVLVGFLDELNRQYMDYVFYEVEPNKLSLKKAQYWEFVGDTDEMKTSERYSFTQDGGLIIEEADILNNVIETKEATQKVDVSGNYEAYPEFGQYEALIKKERGLF